jgi:hypothetical protein
LCARSGIYLHASTVPGIADLPKARGALIAKFLSEASYTHILFVDADIEVGHAPRRCQSPLTDREHAGNRPMLGPFGVPVPVRTGRLSARADSDTSSSVCVAAASGPQQ